MSDPVRIMLVTFAGVGFAISLVIGITVNRLNTMDARIRELELSNVAVQCYINPEICRVIER